MATRQLKVEIVGDAASLQRALGSASAASDSFGGKMQSVGKSMRRTGAIMSAAITAPLVLIGKQSYDASRDFDKAMTMIETQAGAPAGEIARLKNSVIALGTEGTHGPVELAKGLFFVESAGFRGAKAMDILKLAEQGATVGGADLEQTTSALTAAMKTGARGTETATKAMGLLNAIVGQGQMKMQDLVGALSTGALPTFKDAGLGLRDFGSALDIMTARGVPAEKAATNLKMAVLRLTPTSKPAIAAFKTLGLSQTQLADAMRGPGGLPTAIGILRDRYQGLIKEMGASKAAALLQQIFPRGSVSTILTLIGASDELRKKWQAVADQSGGFSAAVQKAMEDSDAKSRKFHATIQALEITVGTILTPILQKLADWVARAANAFDSLSPSTRKIVVTIAAMAAVAGPLLIVFGSIAGAIAALIPAFAALAAVGAPILLVVGAVVALGVAIAAAVLWPDKLKAALQRMGVSAKDAQTIVNDLRATFQAIKAVVEAVWPAIQRIIVAALTTIKGIVNIVMGVLEGDWGRAWRGVKQVTEGAIKGIIAVVTALPSVLAPLALRAGKAILDGIVSGIKQLPQALLKLNTMLLTALGKAAVAAWKAATTVGFAIVSGLASGIYSMGEAAISAAASWLASLVPSWMKKLLGIGSPSKVMEAIGADVVAGFALGIRKEGSAKIANVLKDQVSKAIENVKTAKEAVASSFAEVADAILAAFDAKVEAWQSPFGKKLAQMQAQDTARAAKEAIKQAQDQVAAAKMALALGAGGPDTAALLQAVVDAEKQLAEARRAERERQLALDDAQAQKAHDIAMAKERLRVQQRLATIQTELLKTGNIDKARAQLNKLLGDEGLGKDAGTWGTALGISLAAGLEKSINALVAAANKLANALRRRLKLKSPAEEGPLSDLDVWWVNLVPTLIAGIDYGAVSRAGSDIARSLGLGIQAGTQDVASMTGLGQALLDSIGGVNTGSVAPTVTAMGDITESFSGATSSSETFASSIEAIPARAQDAFNRLLSVVTSGTKKLPELLAPSQFAFEALAKAIQAIGEAAYRTRNALRDTAGDIARLTQQIAQATGGGTWPPRAAGGPVGPRRTYLVGESGPELFMPSTSGRIVPNAALPGGGGSIYIEVNVGGSVVTERDLQESIYQALLTRQRRSGALGFA